MFPQMHTILEPRKLGIATIDHYDVTAHESKMSALRSGEYCLPGKYARLLVEGQLMMSDTRLERNSNYDFVRKAHGNVLVAGLGLGMILHPILQKTEVQTVTVIEKYQDVIDLVAPTISNEAFTTVCADIFEWRPTKGITYNTIYFDIWQNICTDNLIEINRLHTAFRKYLDKSDDAKWMASWMHDELKRRNRRER